MKVYECNINLFWIYTPFYSTCRPHEFYGRKAVKQAERDFWQVIYRSRHRSIWKALKYSNLHSSWPVCSCTWYTSSLSWCILFSNSFFSLLATLLCCVFNIYLNDDELELGQTIRRFSLKQMHSSRNILPNFICFVTGILSAYWYWIDYFPANSTSPWLGVSI